MNGRGTLQRRGYDRRDAEIARLKREVEALRERERAARAEAEDARTHFSELTAMSRRFASSMRAGAGERQQYRRRLAAQYAVSRVLAEARDLDEAAPRIFEILGKRLGWEAGALWTVQGDVLCLSGRWRCEGAPPGAFEKASGETTFRRGADLPGRVWERGEPVWVEDVVEDPDFTRKGAAAEDGLHGAFAFPIMDGSLVGVFEFFRHEVLPPDEDLLRTAALVGNQIEQFVERRRAEGALRESEARQAFLLKLSDTLRTLTTPADIASATVRELRERLDVSRVCYGEIVGNLLRIEHDDARGVPSIVGEYPLGSFDSGFLSAYRPNEVVTVYDVEADERLNTAGRAELRARGIAAFTDVVLLGDEHRATTLAVQHATPRTWTQAEENLIREVAERVRSAIERARAEAAARESEERLQLALDATAMGTFVWHVEEDRGEPDARMRELFGLGPGDALNLRVALDEMIHPDDRDRYAEAVARAAEPSDDGELREDIRVILPDGSLRWLAITGRVAFEGEPRRPARMVGTALDITERKRAEEALRESEERLQKAISIETVGVLFFDLDGNMTGANEAFARMTGYGRDELLDSVHWESLTAPEFQEATAHAAEELADRGEAKPYEKQLVRKDGSRWWGLCAPRRLSGSGSESECVEFILDVTEPKRAEAALRESEERFRALIDKGVDVITISDHDGNITYASPSIEAMSGYTVEEFVNHNPFESSIHPNDVERCAAALQRLRDEPGASVFLQHRYRHKSGEWRWLEGTFTSRFDDPAVGGLVANFRDVTERKEAEEERERLLAQEWRARAAAEERKRISRELHDRVAHSMGVVHQSLELYEVFKERKPSQAEAKMQIARETTREALDLTRNISRELHNTEAGNGLSAALSNLLKTAVPPALESSISVEGDETLIPPRVREQLFLILREAVRNAVSHSDAGRLEIEVKVSPERAVGSVEDDGLGFEEASEGDGDNGVPGTGLHSMRERAELVGGAVSLSSTPGAGTKVEASIPLNANRGGRGMTEVADQ